MISYPMIIISIVTFGITMFFIEYFKSENSHWFYGVVAMILIISLMIFIPLLYRSFVISKWKIWAFSKVRNVHELKKRALQAQILFENEKSLIKYEYYNKNDKKKWSLIQEKFKVNDVFIDDLSISKQTVINHPKTNPFAIILILFFLILGISIIVDTKKIDAIILIIIGLYIAYIHFRNTIYFNNKPQILINENGMKTINTEFYKWNEIENENVITKDNKKYFLVYNHPKGIEKLEITNLNTNQVKLEKLIQIYKGRNINYR